MKQNNFDRPIMDRKHQIKLEGVKELMDLMKTKWSIYGDLLQDGNLNEDADRYVFETMSRMATALDVVKIMSSELSMGYVLEEHHRRAEK